MSIPPFSLPCMNLEDDNQDRAQSEREHGHQPDGTEQLREKLDEFQVASPPFPDLLPRLASPQSLFLEEQSSPPFDVPSPLPRINEEAFSRTNSMPIQRRRKGSKSRIKSACTSRAVPEFCCTKKPRKSEEAEHCPPDCKWCQIGFNPNKPFKGPSDELFDDLINSDGESEPENDHKTQKQGVQPGKENVVNLESQIDEPVESGDEGSPPHESLHPLNEEETILALLTNSAARGRRRNRTVSDTPRHRDIPPTPPASASKILTKRKRNALSTSLPIRKLLTTDHAKHPNVKCISAEDLVRLKQTGLDMQGISKMIIIDCRFPYEFQGGAIRTAVNLWTQKQIVELYNHHKSVGHETLLIFHCEFSSERAPSMCHFFRNLDRKEHGFIGYPNLFYPNLYVLKSGYENFYHQYPDLCEPRNYVKMDNPNFKDQECAAKAQAMIERCSI